MLASGLRRIGDRIADFYASGGDAPYQLYVYEPHDEWEVRRELKDLQLWLQAPPRRIHCAAISLADLFWQALDSQGWMESLVEAEREGGEEPGMIAELNQSVAEVLRQPPTLPDRVCLAVDQMVQSGGSDRIGVFLYRAGALYPAYRTSTLLDDLLGRVRRPVTLLYPGSLVGEGLRFMGVCEPTYGYRAVKVPRGTQT
jgi:Domain of unknown function (DUF1788)